MIPFHYGPGFSFQFSRGRVGVKFAARVPVDQIRILPGTYGAAGEFGSCDSNWLAWAAAGGVAASAMGGYLLTRGLPGGFLGDHADVGNWRCPLGIAALSVEAILILLVVLAAGQARAQARSVALVPVPETARPRTPEFTQRRPG